MKDNRPPGVVVSIFSVSERRPMRRAFKSVTVSMRCGSERPSRSNFHTTRTSPVGPLPRPVEASKVTICDGSNMSTPAVRFLGTKVAPGRADRFQASVRNGRSCAGLPYRLRQLRHGLRAFPGGPVGPDFAQLRPARSRVGEMSRTKSAPGIALGRWGTLGQTHYPVLGDKGPRREPPAIPSCGLSAKISLRLAGRVNGGAGRAVAQADDGRRGIQDRRASSSSASKPNRTASARAWRS